MCDFVARIEENNTLPRCVNFHSGSVPPTPMSLCLSPARAGAAGHHKAWCQVALTQGPSGGEVLALYTLPKLPMRQSGCLTDYNQRWP